VKPSGATVTDGACCCGTEAYIDEASEVRYDGEDELPRRTPAAAASPLRSLASLARTPWCWCGWWRGGNWSNMASSSRRGFESTRAEYRRGLDGAVVRVEAGGGWEGRPTT